MNTNAKDFVAEEKRHENSAGNRQEELPLMAKASKYSKSTTSAPTFLQGLLTAAGTVCGKKAFAMQRTEHPLIGTWVYGSNPKHYRIFKHSHAESLHFDGPNPAGGRLAGILIPRGSDFEAELRRDDGAVFGSMRFSMRIEGTEVRLISKFKHMRQTARAIKCTIQRRSLY